MITQFSVYKYNAETHFAGTAYIVLFEEDNKKNYIITYEPSDRVGIGDYVAVQSVQNTFSENNNAIMASPTFKINPIVEKKELLNFFSGEGVYTKMKNRLNGETIKIPPRKIFYKMIRITEFSKTIKLNAKDLIIWWKNLYGMSDDDLYDYSEVILPYYLGESKDIRNCKTLKDLSDFGVGFLHKFRIANWAEFKDDEEVSDDEFSFDNESYLDKIEIEWLSDEEFERVGREEKGNEDEDEDEVALSIKDSARIEFDD